MNRSKPSSGFSIVELMVAITIGLIITAAIAQIYSSSRATYQVGEGLARVQETGRFAAEFISLDVRMAGYTGCLNRAVTVSNHLNNPTSDLTNYTNGKYLTGHHNDGTGTALTDWDPDLSSTLFPGGVMPIAGTDVLVIRRGSEVSTKLKDDMKNTGTGLPDPSADIKIDGNPAGFAKGDVVIISDCRSADIFQITGPNSFGTGSGTDNNITHNTGVAGVSPGNLTQPLSKAYDKTAELMKLVTRVYYIGRRNNDPANPPSLFRRDLSQGVLSAPQELLEGVERMYILFGEDTDNDKVVNQYLRAGSVADFKNIVGARIGLLVRTVDPVDAPDETVHSVADISVGPLNDRYRRRPFTITVQLRNP